MTPDFASPCQCTNCPGTDCTCGCRHAGVVALQAYPAACACASDCGCEAAESGCACTASDMTS